MTSRLCYLHVTIFFLNWNTPDLTIVQLISCIHLHQTTRSKPSIVALLVSKEIHKVFPSTIVVLSFALLPEYLCFIQIPSITANIDLFANMILLVPRRGNIGCDLISMNEPQDEWCQRAESKGMQVQITALLTRPRLSPRLM